MLAPRRRPQVVKFTLQLRHLWAKHRSDQKTLKDPSAPKENWAVILRSTYSMKSFNRWGRSPRKIKKICFPPLKSVLILSFFFIFNAWLVCWYGLSGYLPKSSQIQQYHWFHNDMIHDDSGCYPSFSNMKPVFHMCPANDHQFSIVFRPRFFFSQSFVSSQSKMVTLEPAANHPNMGPVMTCVWRT